MHVDTETHPESKDTPETQRRNSLAEEKNEHYLLAGRPPLKTLVSLSIGPVLAQVSTALFGIVDTMWVSKAIGTHAVAATSTYSVFENMGRAFGFFLSVAGSSKISALFGSGRGSEASQIVCDILRLAMILGCILPAIFLPIVKSAARWFGASEDIVSLGYQYISVFFSCSFVSLFFLSLGGFLQGEGRTLFFGLCNMGSCLLNMLVLDPFFLFYTGLGIKGAAIATVLADFIPTVILLTMYFKGKFSIKPEFNQFFKPFSPHTFPALRVGFSALIAILSLSIPGVFITLFVGRSTSTPEEYNGALAGCGITFRFAMFTMCIVIGVNNGFLPPASYAYAAKQPERWKWLSIHSIWINFAWCSFTCLLAWTIPKQISRLFSKDEYFVSWAAPMLRNGHALNFISWCKNNAQSMLQSMQKGRTATILSMFTQMGSLIGFACLLYYTDKHNATRLQWAYSYSFAFGFIVSLFVLIKPVKETLSMTIDDDQDDPQF